MIYGPTRTILLILVKIAFLINIGKITKHIIISILSKMLAQSNVEAAGFFAISESCLSTTKTSTGSSDHLPKPVWKRYPTPYLPQGYHWCSPPLDAILDGGCHYSIELRNSMSMFGCGRYPPKNFIACIYSNENAEMLTASLHNGYCPYIQNAGHQAM